MKIIRLKTNRIRNPLGFDLSRVSLSWKTEDALGTRQKRARVTIARDEGFTEIIYDSGMREDADSLCFCPEITLSPRTRYFWRVEAESDMGESAVSEAAWFETGKRREPWQARWISCPVLNELCPVFTREFTLETAVPGGRAYACGLGMYEIYLDGRKLGDEFFAPGCNDYNMWLQYQTYELPPLSAGKHQIEILTADGWYKGRFGLQDERNIYGDAIKVLLEMRLFNLDTPIVTEAGWLARPGETACKSIYDGETFSPGLSAGPIPVTVLEGGFERLTERLSPPVKKMLEIKPAAILNTPAGERVLDMGQNMAGFISVRVRVPAGQTLKMQFGEILQQGNFYNGNIERARAEYVYHSDGKERLLEPHFTYYGFRYAKLEGFPDNIRPEDFTGHVLYSDMEETLDFSCDAPKINRLFQNALWSQRANFLEVPTDCPQRGERLGWTGDIQVFSGTAAYHMDCYAFLSKFCRDLYMTQKELGHVTNTIPAFTDRGPAGAGWGDAAVVVPWNLYLAFGDRGILDRQYPGMKMWVDHIKKLDDENGESRLWLGGMQFGDWLGLDNDDPGSFAGGTDKSFVASACYYHSAQLLSKAASVLGNAGDAKYYGGLAQEIKAAFQAEFFTPAGRLAERTQTGFVLSSHFGLAPEEARERLAKEFAEKLKASGGYLKTGFVGTAYLCQALSGLGLHDQAYRLLFNEDYPSWLYEVNLGATTIWERWNSVLPDGSMNPTGMNSLNHYSYGAVFEWVYRRAAGLSPVEDAPGFRGAVIAPQPNYRMKKCGLRFDSPVGIYEIHWRIQDDGGFSLKITIPFGAKARLILPNINRPEEILPSGQYSYQYMPEIPMLKVYSLDTPLSELLENPGGGPLLDRLMPAWIRVPKPMYSFSIGDLAKTDFVNYNEIQLQDLANALNSLS